MSPMPSDAPSTSAASAAPGRAASPRAESTRRALLAAAREEFAEHGIAGARVDRIARRAGVNKERIYGYFGSKEKLFDAVIETALDELVEVTALPGDDPAGWVGRMFDYYRGHPDLARLLLWEGLYGRTESLPEQRRRIAHCQDKIDSLAAHLGREPSPEIGRLLLTLIGLALTPLAFPQLAELFRTPVDGPQAATEMREHLTAFVRMALANADFS
ncbi:TetR family transcriptional regulator [Actinomadura keratinilytica]|uniref:TetR family transcriptional regulator n=2 Tax=Actinomadura keratinilytica TaxID=547461 RepID=A0ABP7YU36_9ACTN